MTSHKRKATEQITRNSVSLQEARMQSSYYRQELLPPKHTMGFISRTLSQAWSLCSSILTSFTAPAPEADMSGGPADGKELDPSRN